MRRMIAQWVARQVNWPWSRKTNDLVSFLLIQVALAWPATVASTAIWVKQSMVQPANSSPLGYTYSLILFWLPCLLFGGWTLWVVKDSARRWAFSITVILLTPLGFLLDFLFGRKFLTFENPGATLAGAISESPRFHQYTNYFRWRAYDPPGKGLSRWFGGLLAGDNWKPYLPVEEFAFYALGFVTILFIYVWADAVVFRRHKVDRKQRLTEIFDGVRNSFITCMALGLELFLFVLWYQSILNPGGFPGYFLFLLIGSILPTILCFHVAYYFTNWRALIVAWLLVLTISQFWEGALGVPYQWWGYKTEQMIGWFILPQCQLPIEAILVWSLASWTSVLVFETILSALYLPAPSALSPTRWARARRRLNVTLDLLRPTKRAENIRHLHQIYESKGQMKEYADPPPLTPKP